MKHTFLESLHLKMLYSSFLFSINRFSNYYKPYLKPVFKENFEVYTKNN